MARYGQRPENALKRANGKCCWTNFSIFRLIVQIFKRVYMFIMKYEILDIWLIRKDIDELLLSTQDVPIYSLTECLV